MSSSTPGLDEKSARVRNLLSSYYGTPTPSIPDSPVSQASSRDQHAVRQPRSIGLDSTTFDSSRYIDQLLSTTRLQALLKKHLDMSAEIKSLDSDMQMLVYENYNKFISATDTIRTMKSSVDDMDGKMQTLQQLIGSVAAKSTQVNTKLQERHDQMEDLGRVRGLLIKLQAVFYMPKHLRAAIDQGAIEIAVDKYADIAGLLKAYGHKGAFRKINTEVQGCAKEIVTILRSRLAQQGSDSAECINLLEKMGEPIDALQDLYLTGAKGKVDNILVEAENLSKQHAEGEEGGEGAAVPESLPEFVVQLDEKFVAELARIAASYDDLFSQKGRQKLTQVARALFARYLQILQHRIRTASATATASSATAILQIAARPAEKASVGWGALELASALSTFATDVSRLHSLLPELSAQDRAAEVVERTVRQHVGACFQQLEKQILSELSSIQSSLLNPSASGLTPGTSSDPKTLSEGFKSVSALLDEGASSLLQAMKSYQQQSVILRTWQDVFVDLVQGHVQHLFLSLLEAKEDQEGSEKSLRMPPSFILLLARVVEAMESKSVIQVLELLAALFAGQGAAAGSEQPPAFVAGEVARRLGAAAKKLLEEYVKVQGSQLARILQAALNFESQGGKPEASNELQKRSQAMTQMLSQAEDQVSALVKKRSGSQPSRDEPAGGSTTGSAVARNVARLFSHKTALFDSLSFTKGSILGGIVRVALTALVENIRLLVFPRDALQQLQSEILSMRQNIARHLQGQEVNAMHLLLDEALAAATERCLEPVVLDPAILEKSLAAQLGA